MSRFELKLSRTIYDAMIAYARDELPAECCGLIGGTVRDGIGHALAIYPLVNTLNAPDEFESDPMSMLRADKAMRASKTEILAVYHSHPTSDPIPSIKDRERNLSESVMTIIVGLKKDPPDVRFWWIASDGVREADVVVESIEKKESR